MALPKLSSWPVAVRIVAVVVVGGVLLVFVELLDDWLRSDDALVALPTPTATLGRSAPATASPTPDAPVATGSPVAATLAIAAPTTLRVPCPRHTLSPAVDPMARPAPAFATQRARSSTVSIRSGGQCRYQDHEVSVGHA